MPKTQEQIEAAIDALFEYARCIESGDVCNHARCAAWRAWNEPQYDRTVDGPYAASASPEADAPQSGVRAAQEGGDANERLHLQRDDVSDMSSARQPALQGTEPAGGVAGSRTTQEIVESLRAISVIVRKNATDGLGVSTSYRMHEAADRLEQLEEGWHAAKEQSMRDQAENRVLRARLEGVHVTKFNSGDLYERHSFTVPELIVYLRELGARCGDDGMVTPGKWRATEILQSADRLEEMFASYLDECEHEARAETLESENERLRAVIERVRLYCTDLDPHDEESEEATAAVHDFAADIIAALAETETQ